MVNIKAHTMKNISLIVAMGLNGEIGKDNQLLYPIKDDLKRFKELTSGHTVVMGRKTWDSLPEKFKPLPNRRNIVLTRDKRLQLDGAEVFTSTVELQDEFIRMERENEQVFIIGGGEIYKKFYPLATKIYFTIINKTFPSADTYLQFNIDNEEEHDGWEVESEEEHADSEGVGYKFVNVIR